MILGNVFNISNTWKILSFKCSKYYKRVDPFWAGHLKEKNFGFFGEVGDYSHAQLHGTCSLGCDHLAMVVVGVSGGRMMIWAGRGAGRNWWAKNSGTGGSWQEGVLLGKIWKERGGNKMEKRKREGEVGDELVSRVQVWFHHSLVFSHFIPFYSSSCYFFFSSFADWCRCHRPLVCFVRFWVCLFCF